ncbi:MAG: formate/nitrite transporter family protein [Nitrosomonas sp. PRO4]|nr:formate/nitrite transporter family protein [Nitrosomonas sp. PRO4]
MTYVIPEEILASMLQAGAKKASLPVKHLLIRGFLAGAFLGYATTLAILAATQTGWGIAGALVFPVGFVIIVLLGLELATGNFALIPIAVKDNRVSLSHLFKNWTWVLIGNLIGSVLYAYLYCVVATKMGSIDPASILALQRTIDIAETKTLGYAQFGLGGTISAFVSAILCNWMVALGAVMGFASTTTTGKIVAMWLPIMTFFALGYEHAIVNMFVIPAGMWLGANISLIDWWVWNGIPVIAGNLFGGMFFTGFMLYWSFGKRNE